MTVQLYQLYCWTGTPTAAATEKATIWAFSLPESSGSSNRMLLRLIYPTQTAPTITDNNGNTWPPSPTGVISSGNNDLAVWDLKNNNSGITKITATFTGPTQPVGGELIEWSGLSTTLANGGVQTAGSVTQVGTGGIETGSFTPSPSNSGNGGYLIVAFYQDAFGNDAGPTQWNADVANGFAMLQGNSIFNTTSGQGQPGASQFVIQSGSPAAINPKIFPVGDTTTAYNCLAIALPLDPAGGTPPPNTLRIAKMMKVATAGINNATSTKFNFPTVGNTRVYTTSTDTTVVTAASDTDGSYTDQGFGATRPAWYVAKNQLPDAANIITLTFAASQTGNMDCCLFDIANAATGTVVGAKGNNSVGTTATQTSITNSPNITPTTNNSLILVTESNGNGPTLAPTSPSGAQFGNVIFDKGGANAVTNATTAAGNAVLHFASVPSTIVNGTFVQDASTPAAIPGTTVLSQTGTTVTLNANVVTPGVGSGNTITFTSESDAGTVNSGDAPGGGILHNTSTAAQSWSWGIIAPGASGGGSSVNSSAIEILAAAAAAGPPNGWMSAADDLPRRRYVPGYDVGLLPIAPRPQFLAQGIAVELPPRRRLILPEEPTFAQPPAAGTPTPSVLWDAPDDNPRQKKPPLDPGALLPLFQASTIVAPPNGWQSPVDDLPPRRPVNNEVGLLPLPPAPVLLFLVPGDHPLPPARRPSTDAAGLQQQVTFTPVSGMAWAGTPGDNVVSRPLTWLLSSTAFSPQVIAPPPPPPSGVHYITTSRGKLIAVIGVS